MDHVDLDVLALVALGEPASDADLAHIGACERCAEDLLSLTETVRVGRSVTGTDALVAPGPQVWDRIAGELSLSGPGAGAGAGAGDAGDAGGATDVTTPTSDPARASEVADVSPPIAPVIPLRRPAAPWLAAAAAAGVVIGGVGGVLWSGQDDAPAAVVAETGLDPLPGWEATGHAAIHEAPDGTRELVLEVDADVADDAYQEVWLIDADVTRLVSLGVLEGSSGRFTVPTGLDLGEFVVVDVSSEPYDGDPAHSGDSIVRGVIDA